MKNKAFSLIELIIVIMFLGILSVLAVLAVNSIFKKGVTASTAANRKMLIPMIEDYLIEDFAPASCTLDVPTQVYTCPLNVLNDAGYIKSEVCNKADNKKIDLTTTVFEVEFSATTEDYICKDCTTFTIKNTSESCSQIKLEEGN